MAEKRSDLETEFIDLWWWSAYRFLTQHSASGIAADEIMISKYNIIALLLAFSFILSTENFVTKLSAGLLLSDAILSCKVRSDQITVTDKHMYAFHGH